jgi:hypothetical protein
MGANLKQYIQYTVECVGENSAKNIFSDVCLHRLDVIKQSIEQNLFQTQGSDYPLLLRVSLCDPRMSLYELRVILDDPRVSLLGSRDNDPLRLQGESLPVQNNPQRLKG